MNVDAVIVGNGVAGYNCASRLARAGLRPLLVGPGLPYDRPPLTKAALAAGEPRPLADSEKLLERGINALDVTCRGDFATRARSSTSDASLPRRFGSAKRLVDTIG